MKGQRFENGVFPVSSQKQDYLCKTLSLAYKGSKRGGMEKCGQDMKKYLDSLKESSLCVNRIPGLAL